MFLWRAELAEQWSDVETLLTTTSELAAWTLASDGVTHCDVVQHNDGTFVGINRVAGESFEVTRDAQIICRLNLRALAALIVDAFEGRLDYVLPSADAKVHRIGRLPPKLGSAPIYLCVRSDDESLSAVAASLASTSYTVILVPTLLHTRIDIDNLARQFKTIVAALDVLCHFAG